MTQATDERTARKEYIRRRQKTVFGIAGAILVIALVISLLFFFHVGGLGNVKSTAVQPNYGHQAPCAIKDKNGVEIVYTVDEVLVPDYTKKIDRTMIVFGKNGINQAYTVASNFTDAMLVMDDRQDQLVDVVVGATFDNLADVKSVPAAGKPITSIKGCVAADKMTNLSKASEHDAVNPQS